MPSSWSPLPNDILCELTRAVVRDSALHDVARWARTCRAAACAARGAVAPAYDDRRLVTASIDRLLRVAPPDYSLLICDRWSTARRMVGAWLSALPALAPLPMYTATGYYEFIVAPVWNARQWRMRVWYARPGRRRHSVALATTSWLSPTTSWLSPSVHQATGLVVVDHRTYRRYCLETLRADVDAEMRRGAASPFPDGPEAGAVACRALGVVHGTKAVWFRAATQRRIARAHGDDTLLDYRARLSRVLRECGALIVECRKDNELD